MWRSCKFIRRTDEGLGDLATRRREKSKIYDTGCANTVKLPRIRSGENFCRCLPGAFLPFFLICNYQGQDFVLKFAHMADKKTFSNQFLHKMYDKRIVSYAITNLKTKLIIEEVNIEKQKI